MQDKLNKSDTISSMRSKLSTDSSISKRFFEVLKTTNKFQISKLIQDENVRFWEYFEEKDLNNALHFCVLRDHLLYLKLFFDTIEERFNQEESFSIISTWINKRNEKGDTCVHYAAYNGNIKIIVLLSKYDISADFKNNQGNGLMHMAAQGNQPQSLIYYYYKYGLSPLEGNKDGSTPLHWACYSGCESAFNFILQFYNTLDIRDNDGLTALHLAVIADREDLVKKLLQRGADRLIKDNKGRTALDIAKTKGYLSAIKTLQDKNSCSLFILRSPNEKIEKSNFNVYVFFSLFFILEFFYISYLLPYINSIALLIISILIMCSLFFCYLALLYKDPGSKKVKNNIRELFQLIVNDETINDYCPHCAVKIVPYQKHCIICDICTEEFDHHCYWINGCVGKNNILYFRVFLFITYVKTLIICITSMIGKFLK